VASRPYLILDPTDDYARRMVEFLARHDRRGVAVLTTPVRERQWRTGWGRRLGEAIAAGYVVDGREAGEVARELRADFPQGFTGIVPWDEMSVLFGAELSDHLGLGWNSRRVIERCRDKGVMKEWVRWSGAVRVNAGRVVKNATEALAFQAELGSWPIVVKPTGGAGSMDVTFAESPEELLRGCQQVLEGESGAVLLEEYVGGDELAINGMVDRAGDFLATDVWLYDKRDSHGVRNLYYQTLKLSTGPLFWQLVEYAARVLEVLELRRAPVHMEVKVDARGPCLIEVAARLPGGNQPALASQLHGRSLFELAACHYLDELPLSAGDVDYARYDSFAARILSGIQPVALRAVSALHGLDEVRALPSFAGTGLLRPVGAFLPQTRDLRGKSYEVYLMHPDPLQVERDARRARELLRYE
jgi:glutathione synthase/RimK-type ligase-like ATP-grasp enzyme